MLALAIACQVAKCQTPENVPVGFYGKVIDQDGNPVPKAKVTFDLVISHMAQNATETIPTGTETESNGDFKVVSVSAYGIDKISIIKIGYKLSSKVFRSYTFGLKPNYRPNVDNPIIFRMWKEGIKEQLIGASWRGKVNCDGRSNRFDLLGGHENVTGSLEIMCTRTPLNYESTERQPYSYKLQISVLGGGVQQTDDEFTYRAPDNGYQPSVIVEHKPGDPQWAAGVEQEFYIRTSDGKYGAKQLFFCKLIFRHDWLAG